MSGTTPSQTVGPFFSFGLCVRDTNHLVPEGSDGAIRIVGRVADGEGAGVPDAMVEIWQAGPDGVYRSDFGWGRSGTDGDGGFSFVTVKPGPVASEAGVLAPHLSVLVFARGLLKPLLTRMYFPDEPDANAADPVLAGVSEGAGRATLVGVPDPAGLRFDIRLQGEDETAFFAL
jgi:protocatechuate 3,4-dioxygenase, alpha subunit